MVSLSQPEYERENTLCCGSSLANFTASNEVRQKVALDTYHRINKHGAKYLVTSCPLCKKSFERVSGVTVYDISELVKQIIAYTGTGR